MFPIRLFCSSDLEQIQVLDRLSQVPAEYLRGLLPLIPREALDMIVQNQRVEFTWSSFDKVFMCPTYG